MYARQAQTRDEAWLLKQLADQQIDDPEFRSHDYLIAVDTATGDDCGFGRVSVPTAATQRIAELRYITLFEDCSDHQRAVTALLHGLIEKSRNAGAETAYLWWEDPTLLSDLPFSPADGTVPTGIRSAPLETATLYSVDISAALGEESEAERLDQLAAEFGYDETTTTKYSVK